MEAVYDWIHSQLPAVWSELFFGKPSEERLGVLCRRATNLSETYCHIWLEAGIPIHHATLICALASTNLYPTTLAAQDICEWVVEVHRLKLRRQLKGGYSPLQLTWSDTYQRIIRALPAVPHGDLSLLTEQARAMIERDDWSPSCRKCDSLVRMVRSERGFYCAHCDVEVALTLDELRRAGV